MPKQHRKEKSEGKELSAVSQEYKGPINLHAMKEQEELYTVPLLFTGSLTSTAGAVLDAFYTNDPVSYALAEWNSLAALYGEYRVLGIQVEYYPINRYSKTTTQCTPLVVFVDRDAPTSLSGSYLAAAQHESARILSLEDPWKEAAKMQNAEESQFKQTNLTSADFSVKFYADGLSVSSVYGRVFVRMLIQFRGRR